MPERPATVMPLAGVPHLLERVRIEELGEWLAAHGLVIAGKATLTGDGSDFPPILIARRET